VHQRHSAIDRLRGLVMVLMVLDHSRDFLGASSMDPRDFGDPVLFFTRWITHLCAPVFAFLAGASAWLAVRRYPQRWQARRHLLQRGFWLIVLELTWVRFAWTFSLRADFILLQVLWVLGWGLIVLALMLHWPPWLVGVLGAGILLTHNLLDGMAVPALGLASWLWSLLHQPRLLVLAGGHQVWVLYSLLPWIGVMALGYGFAPNLLPGARRDRFFWTLGAGVLAAFVLLRGTGVYGDPQPWEPQASVVVSLLAFVNCEKYPSSLQFLLMTLGPVLVLYPWFGGIRGPLAGILRTYGQAPLLLYLLHIPLIHLFAVLLAALRHQPLAWLFADFPLLHKPVGYGLPLLGVYWFWLVAVLLLYFPCRCRELRRLRAE
jgi:uncharacterized membrane protein